ncbi:hypothetical protein [Arenimonas sp.]|uniref:hypothetical protein n=1 Tax=Arenimonas sp. TaxID=1872635 RepID=UPI0039E5F066
MTALLGLGLAFSALAQNPPPQPIATIDKITGKVMVNEGKAFAPGRLQQRLKPGDRVMVMDKSKTTIVFDDDCRLDIEANKLVVVPDRSTCAGGYLAEQGINPGGSGAIGSSGVSGGKALLPLAIGAVVVAVVLDEDDSSP